jgi:hypothetical protein
LDRAWIVEEGPVGGNPTAEDEQQTTVWTAVGANRAARA